jgi:hypothetical protein
MAVAMNDEVNKPPPFELFGSSAGDGMVMVPCSIQMNRCRLMPKMENQYGQNQQQKTNTHR